MRGMSSTVNGQASGSEAAVSDMGDELFKFDVGARHSDAPGSVVGGDLHPGATRFDDLFCLDGPECYRRHSNTAWQGGEKPPAFCDQSKTVETREHPGRGGRSELTEAVAKHRARHYAKTGPVVNQCQLKAVDRRLGDSNRLQVGAMGRVADAARGSAVDAHYIEKVHPHELLKRLS